MRTPLFGIFVITLAACGGGAESAPPPAAPASGAQDAGAALAAPASTYDASIPPERAVPPLALGSKIAKVRGKNPDAIGDAPLPACAAVPAAAPEAMTAALVKACAGGAKPVAGQTVTVKDTDPGATIALAATRGCYRVLAAAPPAIESYVIDVLDSRGGLAAEGRASGRTLVVPAEGPLCFEADDAAKIVVSAGRGAGPISVQVTRE